MGIFDTMTAGLHTIPEWLELLFLAFCIGTLACRLWVLDDAAGAGLPARCGVLTRIWRLLGIAAVALTASSVGDLLVRAAEMSGQPLPAVFPVLPAVVFRTHLGHVWLIRIAALILLSIALQAGGRYRESRPFMAFLFALCGIVAMTKSASGHAADAGDFSVAEIMDWLHLMAASLWGGGLLVLSVAILPELARGGTRSAPVTAGVARRFSRIAGFAIGIIAVTSLYNGWSFVGSPGALWKTPYGWTVIAKTVLFLLLICHGAFNRYVRVPLLQERAGLTPASPGMADSGAVRIAARFRGSHGRQLEQRFMRSVRTEALLMVLVLFCAALLRHESPARHHAHRERAGGSSAPSSHHGGRPHPHNH